MNKYDKKIKEVNELYEEIEKHVLLMGRQFGYGFLIRALRQEWANELIMKFGFSKEKAKEATDIF